MKITAILHNLSDLFYSEWDKLSPIDKFHRLDKLRHNLPHCIKLKFGNGNLRDQIEANGALRRQNTMNFVKLEPRRGYKLATFEIGA